MDLLEFQSSGLSNYSRTSGLLLVLCLASLLVGQLRIIVVKIKLWGILRNILGFEFVGLKTLISFVYPHPIG